LCARQKGRREEKKGAEEDTPFCKTDTKDVGERRKEKKGELRCVFGKKGRKKFDQNPGG